MLYQARNQTRAWNKLLGEFYNSVTILNGSKVDEKNARLSGWNVGS